MDGKGARAGGVLVSRRDSFSLLRDVLRWRVAVVLAVLVVLLMVALGALNTSLGLADTALLAWLVLGVGLACLGALLVLPQRIGGTLFFASIVLLLLLVVPYGLFHDRPMQHWAYIMPPVLVFLVRPGPALAGMVGYGGYATLLTAPLLAPIDTVRFASGYGLLVCFMYTYALLQHRAGAMLRFHSERDALTNCLNRRTFNETLAAAAAAPADAGPLSFLLVDIDHFKAINDRHGHLTGDRVITEVAAVLGRELPHGAPLFRYGGEEFAVLVADPEPAALALAEALRAAVQRTPLHGLAVTVSIGVAGWSAHDETADAALARADAALYAAKRKGRNRVERGALAHPGEKAAALPA